MIQFDDFTKVEMKVGTIVAAEPVEKSDKLLKLTVDFNEPETTTNEEGEETKAPKHRQVLSGIAKSYLPEDIIGKQFVFVTNLEPRSIMGLESQAMILAASGKGGAVAMTPEKPVAPGSTLG